MFVNCLFTHTQNICTSKKLKQKRWKQLNLSNFELNFLAHYFPDILWWGKWFVQHGSKLKFQTMISNNFYGFAKILDLKLKPALERSCVKKGVEQRVTFIFMIFISKTWMPEAWTIHSKKVQNKFLRLHHKKRICIK